MSMVKRTPTLQSLSVTQSQYFVSYRPMLNIIQNHRGLRRFSLKSTQEYYLDHVHEIIEACSKIDYLHLDLWRQPPKSYDFHGRISERSATAKDRFRRMQYTKFRELNLELHNESMAHDLLMSLIERCPLLEKLSIAGRFKSTTLSDLSTILQTGVCPSLSTLELGDSHDTRHGPGDLATLIRSIGCGSNNKGINNGNGSDSGGLEALSLYNGTRFGPLAISALTQCHAKTLTTLRWPQLTSLNLSLFGDILKGLPRLQTLQARVWLNLRVKDGPDMDRVFEKQWNCPDLINLELDLGLSCNFHSTADPLWKGSLSDRCMTYVFSQIARLVTLKKLEIRSEVALLILREPGYLGMLSGLKQLQSLRFDRWESFEIGAEDAKWMIENWPKLSQVVEIWRLQGILPQRTRGRALEGFTQTLVTLRPWLRTT
ncbi:hypothetical protein BGX21_009866 [Mortierella sp. AD011]|nr:hypothetical protein BGX20_010071 [Mortierella sp. AD010]KAF9395522.1 hypothetical protein BGX21_009866 [Mortierella sp. AD011]